MEKIKILYYDPSSGYGGSSRCLRDWLTKLDKNTFKPYVAVLDDGPVIQEIIEIGRKNGFEVVSIFNKKGKKEPVFSPALVAGYPRILFHMIRMILPLTIKLAIYIKKNRINIVHVNTTITTGIEAILAAKITGTPSICHLHATRKWLRSEKFFGRWVRLFICLNDDGEKLYQQYINIRQNKLIKIFNGIDLDKRFQKHDLKKEFMIDNDYKLAGIVGRIAEGKGQDIFLRAAKIILSKCPKTKFFIVGDSLSKGDNEIKNSLLALAKELNLLNDVVFTGWRNDALNIVSNMDVLVQASTTFPEGFSLILLEAMALRVPLVVTNIPGVSEIVINGKNGFLVKPGVPEDMAEAVIKIIENKELANEFSKEGWRRTKDLFDLNKIVDQIENTYFDLIPKPIKS